MGTESTGMQSVYTEVLMAPQGPTHMGIHSIDNAFYEWLPVEVEGRTLSPDGCLDATFYPHSPSSPVTCRFELKSWIHQQISIFKKIENVYIKNLNLHKIEILNKIFIQDLNVLSFT